VASDKTRSPYYTGDGSRTKSAVNVENPTGTFH
jgi:hypothetical protein